MGAGCDSLGPGFGVLFFRESAMRRAFLCCLVLTFSLPLLALFNPKIRTYDQMAVEQRRVVSAYCRLDFQGARLSPEGWERIKNLSAFHENPDFNSFFIASRYQLIETSTPSSELSVTYAVIGRYEDGAGYMPMPSMRTVTFKTHDQSGELRIIHIDPAIPFVSRQAAIDWLKAKLAIQKGAFGRAQIEDAIRALEVQNAGTPASQPPASK
jgi:hypothetical protein